MSTLSLPAASLRTGDRLPARRVLPWVPKYLIWKDLLSICSVDFRIASIFSLLFRERAGCRRYVRLDILPMLGRDPPAVGSRRLGGRSSYCLCSPEGDLALGLRLARAASPVIAAPRTGVCSRTRSGPTVNAAIPPWWPQQHQRTLFRVADRIVYGEFRAEDPSC